MGYYAACSVSRLCIFFLGVCASDAVLGAVPADAPVAVDDSVAAVYAEIDTASALGRSALRAVRAGDVRGGSDTFEAARKQLRAIAARCADLQECRVARVLHAQDRLIARQAQALRELAPSQDTGAVSAPRPAADSLAALLPESARSVNLFKGRELGTLIEQNEPLRSALREWLTWLRPNLLDAYEHYQYMRHKMWPAYAEAGLPEALLFAILAQESGGKVHAVSRAGAAGPLQFMRGTGLRYGLGIEDGFDTRYDPQAATRANVAYLNEQFARLNNDLELALGAYNGGEGRMARLSPRGKRRFWDRRVVEKLPRETREYVPMVLAAAWLFLHPERYGLAFPELEITPGAFALERAMSLNELSICLGQKGNPRGWFRTLRNLNPRWDPNERLPQGTQVEAPASAAEVYADACTAAHTVAEVRALQEARIPGVDFVPHAGRVRTHVVRRGESLSAIARKHGCGYGDIKRIAKVNRIAAPDYALREGQKLEIPLCGA